MPECGRERNPFSPFKITIDKSKMKRIKKMIPISVCMCMAGCIELRSKYSVDATYFCGERVRIHTVKAQLIFTIKIHFGLSFFGSSLGFLFMDLSFAHCHRFYLFHFIRSLTDRVFFVCCFLFTMCGGRFFTPSPPLSLMSLPLPIHVSSFACHHSSSPLVYLILCWFLF